MAAFDALSMACATIAFLIAAITGFFAYPEIPVVFLLIGYYFSFYVIAVTIGEDSGWHNTALKLYFLVLAVTVFVFAAIYWRYGLISSGKETDISFLNAVYFSITTWTTLGYGDFAPTPRIRHITSIQAIMGYGGLGLLITLVSGYLNNLSENRRQVREHNRKLIENIKKEDPNQSSLTTPEAPPPPS